MRWAGTIGIVVAVCALGACTSLLGDFNVDDASVDAASETSIDAPLDVAVDTSSNDAPADVQGDTGPTCGEIGLACCGGNTCTTGVCCGPKCLDVSSDPTNCGACNHDCGGGTCSSKQCQPQLLGTIPDAMPGRIRVDASRAYFITVNGSNSGALYSCTKTGCTTPTKLFGGLNFGYDLALDDTATTAFVSDFNAGKMYSCAVGGCGSVPTTFGIAASQYAGLDYRGRIFGSADVQPHEFNGNGTGDLNLGNGNEGCDWIVSPPGATYVYWNGGANHTLRVGKEGVTSPNDYWTSTAAENVNQLAANANSLAWVAQGPTSTSIYACAVTSFCPTATQLSASERVGGQAGTIAVDPSTNDVYWLANDLSASHVMVRTCPTAGCAGNPTTLASIATVPGKGVQGGVTADATFVYFTLEDSGKVSLYRVAK